MQGELLHGDRPSARKKSRLAGQLRHLQVRVAGSSHARLELLAVRLLAATAALKASPNVIAESPDTIHWGLL